MPRWKKYSLIVAGSVLGLLLLSMLMVPWQIKVQGSKWLAENTTRKLTIEKAFFNPFTLTIEIEGLKLSEQSDDKSFVTFRRLMLSGSVRSLIDLAVILDRVELDQPYVNIELLGKQEFNFSDFTRLGGETAQPTSADAAEPLHFSLNNIVITDGRLDFTDQTSEKKSQHQIRELSLSVPFIGNIPYLTDEYVTPQLRMLLNGSEIRADGQLKPFHQSVETSLTLLLDEIDLAFYAFHSPLPLPVEVKSGTLDTQIDLVYRISSTEQPKLMLGGELALTDIDIRGLDGQELFKMPTLILDLDWANLMQQDFNLHSLDIYQPQLFVTRDRAGLWNLLKLLPTETGVVVETVTDHEPQPATLPLLTIEKLALHEGTVHYRDEYPPGGFQETFQGINLQLDNLSSHRDQLTELNFKLQTAREMSFNLAGRLGLNPLSADLALLLNGLQLKPYYPYLATLLTRPLEGQLNLATHLQLGPETSLRLEKMQLALHQLVVPFTDRDRFTLADLSITGGAFDLEQLLLKIGSITLSEGDLQARRNADGSLSPLALLRDTGETVPAKTAGSGPLRVELPWQQNAVRIDSNDFQLQLDSIALEKFALQFTDASLAKKPQLKIKRLDVDLKNLAYPKSRQSPFQMKARIGRKGRIAFSGNLAHSPLRLQAQTNIKALPLTLFNDFLPENVKVSLKDGKLYSDLAIKLTERPERLTGSFAGRVNISDISLRDPFGSDELLAWKSLDLEGIKGEIAPFKLQIKEVALSDYLAKIQIDRQGRVNLTNVTSNPAEDREEPAAEPPQEELAGAEESAPPVDIRIDALTLQGGTVSFTDRHLPSTFTTTMYQLGGRVTGLASDAAMQADVDLRGQLENHSPLTISGKLNPLSKDLYADLTIRFQDIDLVPMTPYSGTFLGYAIDKGKLYLDLNYHIEQRQISADNRVMIDQFTFGDSIDSDQATSLPISLAIALLKDSSGEIHLDLPISGDLDDPSFSVAGTVFTILKNLLVKAATSPFALLGAMFGGDEGFSSVDFAFGSDQLNEEQRQKLAKLAEMLSQRPALTLEVSAFVDPDNDPEAYRKRQLQQLLLAAKAGELEESGKTASTEQSLQISAEEYPDYLTQVYKAAEFPRPRNFVGLLKKLPVEEMEKLLLANILADDEQLQQLSNKRAMAVRNALYAASEAIKEQIFLKNVDIYQKPEAGVASRVDFNISSK